MTVSAPVELLPRALLDPAAYPHAPATVRLRETHISWVFLAGDRAYKVKKPVTFPFLDYGTPARRRDCCRAELRLGRHFAPGRYLDVVALVPRGTDGVAVAHFADERAIDYAVVMRRYDEQATLEARLRRGSVNESDLAAVGRSLAEFHADAPVVHEAEPPVTRLAAVIEETLTSLDEQAPLVPPGRVAALRRFCLASLSRFGPELERREAAGLVREGHGDLRAEHILMLDPIEAVDALEFDRGMRVADVAFDLAFLVMDVARHDDALARALIRGYAAGGGALNGADEPLLAFLCAVRALVRAKVDLLRAAQLTGVRSGERTARGFELLTLAERFAWRARLPRLVCVAGLAGAGKSTLSEALGAVAGRDVISTDRLRKLRAGIAPQNRAAPGAYSDAESRAVYAELGHRALAELRERGGAIVDGTFRRSADAAEFMGVSRSLADAGWLLCEAPPELMLARARPRGEGSVSDADPRVVAGQLAVHRDPLILPAEPLARIMTTRSPRELLAELAERLDAALAGGR